MAKIKLGREPNRKRPSKVDIVRWRASGNQRKQPVGDGRPGNKSTNGAAVPHASPPNWFDWPPSEIENSAAV